MNNNNLGVRPAAPVVSSQIPSGTLEFFHSWELEIAEFNKNVLLPNESETVWGPKFFICFGRSSIQLRSFVFPFNDRIGCFLSYVDGAWENIVMSVMFLIRGDNMKYFPPLSGQNFLPHSTYEISGQVYHGVGNFTVRDPATLRQRGLAENGKIHIGVRIRINKNCFNPIDPIMAKMPEKLKEILAETKKVVSSQSATGSTTPSPDNRDLFEEVIASEKSADSDSDFTIIAGDGENQKSFYCHKLIIRRAIPEHFSALSHFEEMRTGVWKLDQHSPEIVEEILHLIYCGSFSEKPVDAEELLQFADYLGYDISKKILVKLWDSVTLETTPEYLRIADKITGGQGFQLMCELKLLGDLCNCSDNWVENLVFAHQHGFRILKNNALTLAGDKIKEILREPEYEARRKTLEDAKLLDEIICFVADRLKPIC